MIDPHVRPASAGDIEQIALLEDEMRGAIEGTRGAERWLVENPPVADWAMVLNDCHVIVGHIGDVVVSFLVAASTDHHVWRVDQVWVTPEARELGFGDAMLADSIAEARRRDAIGIEGTALPGDRHTKNLWERAGIVARLIVTYRAL